MASQPVKERLFANPARPAATAAGGSGELTPGFHAGNADMSPGSLPEISKRLDALGKYLDTAFSGISGYRTPSHSVAVGGTANDPHTQAKAVDVSTNINTVPEATLNMFGLTRPMTTWNGRDERNHIQLASATQDTRNAATVSKTTPPSSSSSGASSVLSEIGSAAAGAGLAPINAAKDTLDPTTIATGIANDLWDAVKPKAEYAGLFVVLVIAGAGLVIFGVIRTTGADRLKGALT